MPRAALRAVEGSGAGDAAILYAGPGAPAPREGETRVQANEGPASWLPVPTSPASSGASTRRRARPGRWPSSARLDSQVAAGWTLADLAELPAESLMVMTDGTPAVADRARTAIARAAPGTVAWLGPSGPPSRRAGSPSSPGWPTWPWPSAWSSPAAAWRSPWPRGSSSAERPFALLRLSGMHLDELRRVALLEAAAPLLLIALASAALGLATAAVIAGVAGGIPWYPPSVGYWVALAGGLALALAVSAAALPLLARTTAPSATRFE